MRKYGIELKYQREVNNLSQSQLSKETGIKQQNISRWENDEAIPSIANCEILADFYGITLDELVGRDCGRNKSTVTYNNSTHNGNNNF